MKGVIFDFNGTLFNDHEKHVAAWSRIAEDLRGRGIDDKELREKCNGKVNTEIIDYLSPVELNPEIKEKLSQKKEAIYRELCQEDAEGFHLIDGAYQLFDELSEAGIPYTIASASIIENIDFFVKSFHLDDYMNPELIVYDDGIHTNKEMMFRTAAENIGVEPEDILIFEDSITGVKGAEDGNFGAVYLMDPEHQANFADRFDLIRRRIDSFKDVTANEVEALEKN